jgi:hypothetical protein
VLSENLFAQLSKQDQRLWLGGVGLGKWAVIRCGDHSHPSALGNVQKKVLESTGALVVFLNTLTKKNLEPRLGVRLESNALQIRHQAKTSSKRLIQDDLRNTLEDTIGCF